MGLSTLARVNCSFSNHGQVEARSDEVENRTNAPGRQRGGPARSNHRREGPQKCADMAYVGDGHLRLELGDMHHFVVDLHFSPCVARSCMGAVSHMEPHGATRASQERRVGPVARP